jgi:adenosine deaminase
MVFLKGRNIYHHSLYQMAVRSSLLNQNITKFEARLAPANSASKIRDHLKDIEYKVRNKATLQATYSSIDRYLEKHEGKESKSEDALFYNYHFIKKESKASKNKQVEEMRCRHHLVRKGLKKQALAIASFRESAHELTGKLPGIDAASSEFDARPEVFAQAFRYLKYYRSNGQLQWMNTAEPVQAVRASFHAGEDFYDLADGLRAIDEAIKFLNLGEGDRIGHALALGIDAKDYYKGKNYCIMLPKQWHLDNLSWLISRINKYNLYRFSGFRQYLEWEFNTLYQDVYENALSDGTNNVSVELYYEAWRLRGDDPYYYRGGNDNVKEQSITFWQRCGINECYPDKGARRKSQQVNALYQAYHFNEKVKRKGALIKRFEVKQEYVELISQVQREMQKEIAKKHLAIETNPTSNVLIGTFRRYDKHPLMQFFNLGLETDPQKLKECPQLFVSINTDDQGVFNTYLENEYALMALALEKAKDEDGQLLYNPAMIYDWLERIRQMGLEMSFKKD